MKKKLPYGIEIVRLLGVIQSLYPECEPATSTPSSPPSWNCWSGSAGT